MCGCLSCPQLGTWPATQACALTGNRTGNPSVLRPALNPLRHTSQGWSYLLRSPCTHPSQFSNGLNLIDLTGLNLSNKEMHWKDMGIGRWEMWIKGVNAHPRFCFRNGLMRMLWMVLLSLNSCSWVSGFAKPGCSKSCHWNLKPKFLLQWISLTGQCLCLTCQDIKFLREYFVVSAEITHPCSGYPGMGVGAGETSVL